MSTQTVLTEWHETAVRLLKHEDAKKVVEVSGPGPLSRRDNVPLDLSCTKLWCQSAEQVYLITGARGDAGIDDDVLPQEPNLTIVGDPPAEFLGRTDGAIDLLYLDGRGGQVSEVRQQHVETYRAARENLGSRSYVLVANTGRAHGGEGSLVIPEALQDGFDILLWGELTLLGRTKRTEIRDLLSRVGPPTPAEASFEDAIQLHRKGCTWEAEHLYRNILKQWPEHTGSLHLLGVVLHQIGDHEGALESIGQAIAIDPTKAVHFNNYGAALHSLDCYVEAMACFYRALQIRPDYTDAFANLGMAQESLGQENDALASYRQALDLQAGHHDAVVKLAGLLEKLGREDEAVQVYEQAIAAEPCAEFRVTLGNLLLGAGQTEPALSHYGKALELDPDCALAMYNLGAAVEDQHDIASARDWFHKAATSHPEKQLWHLRAETVCPAIFKSNDEMDAWREQIGETLDRWRGRLPAMPWDELMCAGVFPNLNFSYHGRNNRDLKEKFAHLYDASFQKLPTPEGSGLSTRKRIGVVVTGRHEGIFLRCMKDILDRLDRDKYELVILCSNRAIDTIRNALRQDGLQTVGFPKIMSEAASRIRNARCDLLYFWEVGSDALNYFLPFAKLAPLQCTSHGSQITSGVPAVEHFFSCELMEIAESDNHYTEALWQARSLLMCQRRLPPVSPMARAHFGLPEARTLYMCLQNPMKIHPDMDRLIGDILKADATGEVVLLAGRHPNIVGLLKDRFAATIPGVCSRVHFLPSQKFEDYCRLLQLADVVLDPPHFGAGSSAYDVFSYGQPLVTLPGKLIVGRVGYAFYTRMGISDLIAQSPEEYVDLAVRVGTDRDYRMSMRERIASASDVLFDDMEAVREHERFFDDILSLL